MFSKMSFAIAKILYIKHGTLGNFRKMEPFFAFENKKVAMEDVAQAPVPRMGSKSSRGTPTALSVFLVSFLGGEAAP